MSARDLALFTLDRLDLPDWPRASLAPSRQSPAADPRDLELGARIESATLKNLLRINHLIEHLADRPLGKIDARVRKILGIALAQILFLDRIPASAAVDEAVKQARRFGRTSAAGFVNAILRRATRDPFPALPTAADDPRGYARLALSHPPELFDRLLSLVDVADALRICEHNQLRPPTILRLAPNVSIDALNADGVTIIPHERPRMVVIQPTRHALLREWSGNGIAQAQDPTSAAVIEHADVRPGMHVLDRCCGLGTKTMQLRERVGEAGRVVAIDPDPHRIRGLQSLVKARGYTNVISIKGSHLNDAAQHIPPDGFDRILIDVPCSNSGVLARRSAARYFQSSEQLGSLEKLQQEILTDTSPAVAPQGLLIYSTCSIWPQENERMVEWFLQSHPQFTLLSQQTTLPSIHSADPIGYHDGGYVAVLKRS
jgi:16S rRNA (cytosine967-C5)-methyltransferase